MKKSGRKQPRKIKSVFVMNVNKKTKIKENKKDKKEGIYIYYIRHICPTHVQKPHVNFLSASVFLVYFIFFVYDKRFLW